MGPHVGGGGLPQNEWWVVGERSYEIGLGFMQLDCLRVVLRGRDRVASSPAGFLMLCSTLTLTLPLTRPKVPTCWVPSHGHLLRRPLGPGGGVGGAADVRGPLRPGRLRRDQGLGSY